MPIDPKDLWTTLPTALQRQIVDEVAAVLAEASHEVRADQTEPLEAKGGRLHPAIDDPPDGEQSRVGLGEVGLILSIDVTRLARNCSDWYPLLDICGLHGCLIADRDGVYDPGSANGRLLLGLKGTISELELHTIRSRLTAGLLAKAERGELALTLPIGLVRDPSGVVVKDPNLEVQGRLELLFQAFLKLRTVAKVMREFNGRGLDLPRRDRHGDLTWARATTSAVATILKNPA